LQTTYKGIFFTRRSNRGDDHSRLFRVGTEIRCHCFCPARGDNEFRCSSSGHLS
jgi:hypothetical protein